MKIEIEADEVDLRCVAKAWADGGNSPLGRLTAAIKKALPEEIVTIEVTRSAAQAMIDGRLFSRSSSSTGWVGNSTYHAFLKASEKALRIQDLS